MTTQLQEAVIWHDVECGSYAADLPLWRSLAAQAGGPILDVGAGTGRVTLDLARRGHEVTALDVRADLLAALRERADGLEVETVVADAREVRLERRFSLCLVPMQTIQLLGGAGGRRAFLVRARDQLVAGGRLAAAIAEHVPPFHPGDPDGLPVPDIAEHGGWVFSSQPVAVRADAAATSVERVREAVAPDGRRTASPDVVRLDHLTAAELEEEAYALGLEPLEPVAVPPTADHTGSRVVILRA